MQEAFSSRHIGVNAEERQSMLSALGLKSDAELLETAVPKAIRVKTPLDLPKALSETELLARARELANQNQVWRSYIGQGYYGCYTPGVILRNILENPAWYTSYTPYQAEISQGRMEALLNFQTMVSDLTGLPMSNASLLDEGTALAEAMALAKAASKNKSANKILVSPNIWEQSLEVLQTRAEPLGIEIVIADPKTEKPSNDYFAVIDQYPNRTGHIEDLEPWLSKFKAQGAMGIIASDLLALTLLKSPGEMGADIVVGNSQRFGVPFGFGGPHAAFLATREEFKRMIPGRIIGISMDAHGGRALRLALQTREQHIRREKATSNICTAQVLLAVMAGMYAVYHGPKGLKKIAERVNKFAYSLATRLQSAGFELLHENYFDSIYLAVPDSRRMEIMERAQKVSINLNTLKSGLLGVALDETTTESDLSDLLFVFTGMESTVEINESHAIPTDLARRSKFLTQSVFNQYHSETEMVRYIHRLQAKDLSLVHAMIPLGSCTMKLNATTEMVPVTWPEFAHIHPFAPEEQTKGYMQLIRELEESLARLTGFDAVSLQPNAGSQGEYAGLLVIRAYHQSRNEGHRNICLIPSSAHGTNPASAVLAGFKVVVVGCDEQGNVDLKDLKARAEEHKGDLAALMLTYPSTHGVFEESVKDICKIVHDFGGQVYMDGANMNALVGVCRPRELGADVSHLNLHKTFCIPHGGGGPGVGPIGVAKHLSPFLPGHSPSNELTGSKRISSVASAPYGSAGILPISWAYITMMGADGLTAATVQAILSANYIAKRLSPHYKTLFTGQNGFVAHECIIDVRPFKESAGLTADDFAKRLMDYGFHAPTMSWPVAGTLMIEPTESESLAEVDRFIEAMISIRKEVAEIESGKADREDNVLKNAPHSYLHLMSENWSHPYTRDRAAFPLDWVRERKFWVPVSRVDNAFGDKNLVCSCQ